MCIVKEWPGMSLEPCLDEAVLAVVGAGEVQVRVARAHLECSAVICSARAGVHSASCNMHAVGTGDAGAHAAHRDNRCP